MAEPAVLPTAEAAFGTRPAQTGEQAFGPRPTPGPSANEIALGGADMDDYFSQGTPGVILDRFGQGFKDKWGAEPLGLSDKPTVGLDGKLQPSTVQQLRDAGIFNDYQAGRYSIYKAFNEGLIRSGALAVDLASRLPFAAAGGFAEAGKDIPGAAAPLALMEAFPAGHFTGLPVPPGVPEAKPPAPVPADITAEAARSLSPTGAPSPTEMVMRDLDRAADLGVIGNGGESGYQDLGPARPPISYQINPESTVVPGADIHAEARRIAPQVFDEYDALASQKQTLLDWRSELAPAYNIAGREIPGETPLFDVERAVGEEETKAVPAAEPGVASELQIPRPGKVALDHLQTSIREIDARMLELSPQVEAAYRDAAARMPAEESAPETAPEAVQPLEAPAATPVASEAEPAAPAPTEPAPAAPEPVPEPATVSEAAKPAEPIPGGIAGDKARQLVAAGRPAEEAAEAGALVQSHYEARAANLTGTTAEDLYRADDAQVRAGRSRRRNAEPALEVAQTGSARRGKLGKIQLATDQAKATITLFKNADASTFIHETGHHWLEQLFQDAADPRATQNVRDDAATVRGWLGVEEGQEIPTKEHEKFARGFERYMMEGHAPSAALASVFYKFREWLTTIYQTVSRLRSPINDDIRGVFDRMLSTGKEEPIVAAERQPPETFADLHEADATAGPPYQAGPLAETVRSERDKVMEAAHPEIQDERVGARAPGADEGSAAGGGVSGQGEPARGDNAGAAGGVQKRGAVGAGGGNAAAASDRVSVGPNGGFEPSGGRYTDRAGNIRLDKFDLPSDVAAYVKEIADQNDNFLTARRGVVSDQQVIDTAAAMGVRPEDLDIGKLRAAFSPEQIEAVRNLFVATSDEAHRLSLIAAEGTDEDVAAYMQARSRLRMAQEYLSAITAETGRGLRAFRRNIPGLDQARSVAQIMGDLSEDRTLNQMREEARKLSQLGTPAKVSGFVRDMDKPGLGAMLLEVWTNWLISGPITHMTYGIGNYLLALSKATLETGLQAGVTAVQRVISGKPVEGAHFGESGAQLYAMVKGQRDGFRAAWESVKSGQTTPLPGEVAAAAGKGTTTPFTRGQAIPNFTVTGVPVPLGSVIRFPGERMVAPIHSYFRAINYERAIAQLAYRTAANEGLSGNAFNLRVADLTNRPPLDMMEAARADATDLTLMGKGGELTRRVTALTNWDPNVPGLGHTRVFRFIDPFVHIGSTILEKATVSGGPLGVLKQSVRDDMMGRNGPLAQSSAIARVGAGTALSIVGAGLAMEGLLTPSAPSDPKERSVWTMMFGLPHALNIGGMSFELGHLGVLGLQLGIAADLYHFADSIGKEDFSKTAALLVHSFTQSFLDESFMRGPSEMIKALDDPDRYGQQFVQNFVSSAAVPFSVAQSQLARQIDPYAREARTILDAIKAKIPFLSKTLPPKYDVWGQPIPNRGWEGVYTQQLQNDPATKALHDAGYFPAPVGRTINGVELTPEQHADYARRAGRLAKMFVDMKVGMPMFAGLPPETRYEMLQKAISDARKMAEVPVKMGSYGTDNDIIRKAMDAKLQALQGSTHEEIKGLKKAR